jgi:hypothetical protein
VADFELSRLVLRKKSFKMKAFCSYLPNYTEFYTKFLKKICQIFNSHSVTEASTCPPSHLQLPNSIF